MSPNRIPDPHPRGPAGRATRARGCTRRRRAGALCVALCTLATLSACNRSKGATRAPEGTGPTPVGIVPVTSLAFSRTLEVEGNLEPAERVLVAPAIPGVIRRITKRAGDRVRKGEVLVEVDPKEVYVGTIQLRVSLASAQARANAANAVLARLRQPLERLRRLYRAKAISKTELDQVEIPYVKAQAERDAALRIIQKVKGELGIAYSKLSEAKLTAPFDGFVVRRLVDPGEVARAFPPTVVLVLTRHHPLYVQIEVGEQDAPRLRRGQPVTVHIDALPGSPPRPGVVEEIIPYVNPMTRTVTVRVRVDNPDARLMPGMSARVVATLAPRRSLAIPAAALATEPMSQRATVFVVRGDRAEERTITFGRAHGPWLEVRSGLRAGESVVLTGHAALTHGAKVAPRPATPPPPPRAPAAAGPPTARPRPDAPRVPRPAEPRRPQSSPTRAGGARP